MTRPPAFPPDPGQPANQPVGGPPPDPAAGRPPGPAAGPLPGPPAGGPPPGPPAGPLPGPAAGGLPPGWAGYSGQPGFRTPSGLFPSGPAARTTHPTYREPHPVRAAGLAAGAASAGVWLLAFGLLAADLRGYLWWTALAGLVAWLTALALARWGDRGVATGIAMITAVGWGIAAATLATRWAETGDWPMW